MATTLEKLNALYSDTPACAELVGLQYVGDAGEGILRVKHGNGFRYEQAGKTTSKKSFKKHITEQTTNSNCLVLLEQNVRLVI